MEAWKGVEWFIRTFVRIFILLCVKYLGDKKKKLHVVSVHTDIKTS